MIIIGLGNPGAQYDQTRHNLGFAVVDQLAAALNAPWGTERDVLVAKIGPHLLLKPQTFMNLSGSAVADFMHYKHLTQPAAPQDLVVVHDDLDFPPGTVQVQRDRSAAGHNGVQSIIDALGTQNFTRYRLGIGNNREVNLPAEDYVLQRAAAGDQTLLDQAITQVVDQLRQKLQ